MPANRGLEANRSFEVLVVFPTELTLMVVPYLRVKDIVSLRLASRATKAFADRLMPQYARVMLKGHAGDAQLLDDWEAEVLLAAHVLNVKNHEALISCPPALEVAFTAGAAVGAAAASQSTETQPTKETQRIASRQELYRMIHATKKWLFGVCKDCDVGCCFSCGEFATRTVGAREYNSHYDAEPLWWCEKQQAPKDSRFTKAIFARDARFCSNCLYGARDFDQAIESGFGGVLGRYHNPFDLREDADNNGECRLDSHTNATAEAYPSHSQRLQKSQLQAMRRNASGSRMLPCCTRSLSTSSTR